MMYSSGHEQEFFALQEYAQTRRGTMQHECV